MIEQQHHRVGQIEQGLPTARGEHARGRAWHEFSLQGRLRSGLTSIGELDFSWNRLTGESAVTLILELRRS
jgi:hypothetical protein